MMFLLGGHAMFGHEPAAHFALDHNQALSLLCECPGKNFAAGAAAQHEEIAFFHPVGQTTVECHATRVLPSARMWLLRDD
jgi:hypothetical protein